MAEGGEDCNKLEMMILKSLANFFKVHKWWRSSFKTQWVLNTCIQASSECAVPYNIHTSPWKEFLLEPPTPLEIPIQPHTFL